MVQIDEKFRNRGAIELEKLSALSWSAELSGYCTGAENASKSAPVRIDWLLTREVKLGKTPNRVPG